MIRSLECTVPSVRNAHLHGFGAQVDALAARCALWRSNYGGFASHVGHMGYVLLL